MRKAITAALLALLTVTTVVSVAGTALGAWGMPEAINDRMETIDTIYSQIMFAGVLVFLVVFILLGYVLVRYRAGSGAGKRTNEAHRGSLKAEVIWTVIPLIIVSWVGLISYDGLMELDHIDEEGAAADIIVTGFQWFWEAEYENGLIVAPQPSSTGGLEGQPVIKIPADEPVLFRVRGGDVIHAWNIVELGVLLDANPGGESLIMVEAPPGEYLAQCREYCGGAHGYMRAVVEAVPMAEFQAWVTEERLKQASEGRLITVTDAGVEPRSIEAAANAPFEYLVFNQGTSPVKATFGNATTGDIAPGSAVWLNTTAPDAGDHELEVAGTSIAVRLVEPVEVQVDLDDFTIEMETTEFEAGQAYRFVIRNVGRQPHNLYIGSPEEELGTDDVLWGSIDLKAGEETTLLMIPDEPGRLTAWCNVAGHYGQGMVGTVSIR